MNWHMYAKQRAAHTEFTEGFPLTRTDLDVLAILIHHGPMTVTQMATHAAMHDTSRPTIYRCVKRLTQMHHVRYGATPCTYDIGVLPL